MRWALESRINEEYEKRDDQAARQVWGAEISLDKAASLINRLPHLLGVAEIAMKSDLLSFRGKLIIGAAYGYVFNPFDIIPQAELPFYGYLDDALILVSLLDEAAEGNPEVVEKIGKEIAMVDSIREDIPEQILRLLSQYTAVIMGAAETLVNSNIMSSVKAGSGCD